MFITHFDVGEFDGEARFYVGLVQQVVITHQTLRVSFQNLGVTDRNCKFDIPETYFRPRSIDYCFRSYLKGLFQVATLMTQDQDAY